MSAVIVAVAVGLTIGLRGGNAARLLGGGAIKHVVIVYQENHSFDQVLGALCVQTHRCDGATTGRLPDGTVIPLAPAPDLVPGVAHDVASQETAIDRGKMDGFGLIVGCSGARHHCYDQYAPSSVPNLTALARSFAISDRTFEAGLMPSWGSHLDLVSGQLDGFTGDNPVKGQGTGGPGWGCDSGKDAWWQPPTGGAPILEPACIPTRAGTGPYRPSPVRWVPTLMDMLDAAGRSWRIDTPGAGEAGYGWAICPTFADCLYTAQAANVRPSSQVILDAEAGTLPDVSFVIPVGADSQHNGDSMLEGDNWIGSVLNAIMRGPEWSSTAVFITYDDCGCFYDHVAPPPGLGVRVPMVIVSPYAKRGYTDSNVASFASLRAFIDHVFGLPQLAGDSAAYDYANSFSFANALPPAPLLAQHRLPAGEQARLRNHPPDPDDPT